jgi:hypothetical protein
VLEDPHEAIADTNKLCPLEESVNDHKPVASVSLDLGSGRFNHAIGLILCRR